MNDTLPEADSAEFPGKKAAVALGAALLLGLALILGFTLQDNARRTTLETTAEFTAVGDTHYFPFPDPPPPPPYLPVASWHGQPLYPADYRRHEFAADDMNRLGPDDKHGYFVYEAQREKKSEKYADDRKRGFVYYLKISPTEYLKVRALKPS